MSPGSVPLLLALVVAAQTVDTRACSPSPTPTQDPAPAPSNPAPTTPAADVHTTADGVRFIVETVATSLEIPWSLAFAPDGRLFVTERPGRVRILDLTTRTSELALTLTDVYAEGEAGLLGLALDPEFAQTRQVFLYYSARLASGARINRLVRYREVGGRLGEPAVLLDNIPGSDIHDGGRVRFGPDGLLYVTTGDAARTALAQDLSSTAGKILRLNRDGSTPRTNPFSSPVYSYGHRNPQGLDWHPASGDLWASEHGSVANDEVNAIDAGANYGWPTIEAAQTMTGMRTPVAFFNPTMAPSGASFYRGTRFPGFANNLFVTALRGTHLLRMVLDPAAPRRVASQERLLAGAVGRLRDVIAGPDGYIYMCTSNRDGRGSTVATDDRILRLVPAP